MVEIPGGGGSIVFVVYLGFEVHRVHRILQHLFFSSGVWYRDPHAKRLKTMKCAPPQYDVSY